MPLNRYIQEGDNPDLTEERLKATFDTDDLAAIIKFGKDNLEHARKIVANIEKHPELKDSYSPSHMARPQRYENAIRKMVKMIQLAPEMFNPLDAVDMMTLVKVVTGVDGYGASIHHMMFLPTMQYQLDEEQTGWWLQKVLDGKIIGTYAQTEMGHGTNINKLETTATYDKSTEEFIIHSPTTTSMKWWPGGLGNTCNHVSLMANLVTNGKNFGPHLFLVQIRDFKTHKPLLGVKVGDIGDKMGIRGVDNGFLAFNNYRIPRRNMLMKYAKVEKDGTYVPPAHPRITYTSMTIIRSELVMLASLHLRYAIIIATRYSCVRRQGEIVPRKGEVKLLEYQTQQNRIFPYIAKTFAFLFAAEEIRLTTYKILEEIAKNKINNTALADLHAASCCLKAYTTHEAVLGIEQARMACGGHGYSEASFLPTLYGCAMASCTMEGDNLVMFLVTARYLVKQANVARMGEGKLGESVKFLAEESEEHSAIKEGDQGDYSHYFLDYEHVARVQIFKAYERLQSLVADGLSPEQAWTDSGVTLTKAARTYSRLFIARVFYKYVQAVEETKTRAVLSDLLHLYLSYDQLTQAKYLLEGGYMSPEQLDFIKKDVYRLYKKIRPNAVSIVDSFDANDQELRSVLGRRDGHVYENLYLWAQDSPLNQHLDGVNPAFDKYMKVLTSKL